MPKKHSRIVQYHKDNKKRRMRRAMRERLKRLSRKQFTFRTCGEYQPEEWEQQKCQFINLKPKLKLFRKKQKLNFIQALQYPIQTNCIFTLYGMITIDENALRNQTKDQSLIKALFNFYSLNEVQINPDYLLLKIHKNKQNYFPISYVIERFKSLGDAYLYDIAQKIEDIQMVFQQMISLPSYPSLPEKQIEKHIQSVKGRRVMLRIAPNCLIFTKELLEIGSYSIDDVGTQCLSYRSFVSDVFLADNYRGQIDKFFELYELGKKLRKGEVNQQEYLEFSKQRETEYIIHKNNNMVKVITNKYNLAPGVGCWEIENIFDQQLLVPFSRRDLDKKKQCFLEESSSRGVKTLSKLTKIPKNLNIDNQTLVCSYKMIDTPSSG